MIAIAGVLSFTATCIVYCMICIACMNNFIRYQTLFATMSSDELKKDKHHQRKISFTALVFLYYIIVIKTPT